MPLKQRTTNQILTVISTLFTYPFYPYKGSTVYCEPSPYTYNGQHCDVGVTSCRIGNHRHCNYIRGICQTCMGCHRYTIKQGHNLRIILVDTPSSQTLTSCFWKLGCFSWFLSKKTLCVYIYWARKKDWFFLQTRLMGESSYWEEEKSLDF